MKTTKNITITENAWGFEVRDNRETVGRATSIGKAVAIAREHNKENKNIVIKTDFINHVIRDNKEW